MYVYACVFDLNGDFLIGTKPMRGYFFCNGLRPAGEPLHGGGLDALPGGSKLDHETVGEGAEREFWEETRVVIAMQCLFSSVSFDADRFAAGYFLVGSADVGLLRAAVVDNLNAGNAAAQDVQTGRTRALGELRQRYPAAPNDNELTSFKVMNVLHDWDTIASWQRNNRLNWYYEILRYLKEEILGGDSELHTGAAS